MRRVTLVTLLLGLAWACLPDLPDLTGKACDAEHACGAPYACVAGACCLEGACEADAGAADGGAVDGGGVDAGAHDAGQGDAGAGDAGPHDAGAPSRQNVLRDPAFDDPDGGVRAWEAIGSYRQTPSPVWSPEGHLAPGSMTAELVDSHSAFIIQQNFSTWTETSAGTTWCAEAWVLGDAGAGTLNFRNCERGPGYHACCTDGGAACVLQSAAGLPVAHDGGWHRMTAELHPTTDRLFFLVILGDSLASQTIDEVALYESDAGTCP